MPPGGGIRPFKKFPGVGPGDSQALNLLTDKFWSISEQHPDLVSCLHIQTGLMGKFGFEWRHSMTL